MLPASVLPLDITLTNSPAKVAIDRIHYEMTASILRNVALCALFCHQVLCPLTPLPRLLRLTTWK